MKIQTKETPDQKRDRKRDRKMKPQIETVEPSRKNKARYTAIQ